MSEKRINLVTILVGTRGTGKTTFLKKAFEAHRKTVLVLDTFDSPAWQDYPLVKMDQIGHLKSGVKARCFSSDTNHMMKAVEAKAYNSTLIFEDATKYVGSKLTPDVKRFVLDSKQKNLDLVFVFHSLASVPSDLIRICDLITLFKTKDSLNSFIKHKYPEEGLHKAFERVKAHPSRYYNETVEYGG